MNVVETKVNPLIKNIELALENNLLYSALSLTLALPDVLSSLEQPNYRGRQKYINWCNKYFFTQNHYGNDMNASDIYALRCAYLHSGMDKLSKQSISKIIDKFMFVYSNNGLLVHRNRIYLDNTYTLQLDLSTFCKEIIDAAKKFLEINKDDEAINKNAEEIITIQNVDEGIRVF